MSTRAKIPRSYKRRWLSIMLLWARGSPGFRLRMRSRTRPSSVNRESTDENVTNVLTLSRMDCVPNDMSVGSPACWG